MNVNLAEHYGMCFGVRDALRLTHDLAESEPVTVLGQLVHNPVVDQHLSTLGVQRGDLNRPGSAETHRVVITAHGSGDQVKRAWKEAGFAVSDTTCPLVRKAHRALECLALGGYFPVVIGEKNHVEVRGLVADFPDAAVISEPEEVERLPVRTHYGVISQTTQPLAKVQRLVELIRGQFPAALVKFIDTVCQPTKDRQAAIDRLCAENDTVIVVGGNNSNNTRQLLLRALDLGCVAHQVEGLDGLNPAWFARSKNVGVTAGTSTLDETVRDVFERVKQIAAAAPKPGLFSR